MALTTVGDLIAELSKQDPDLPVIVSTHYDNDEGLKSDFGVSTDLVDVTDSGSWGTFWYPVDPADVAANPTLYPQAMQAVVIQ